MTISIPGRVVVFDYGEVISRSPSEDDREVLLDLAGVSPDVFWEAYWRFRGDLDQGRTTPLQYWTLMADAVRASWSPSRIQELWAADFRGWISVEPGTIDLLAELHDGGTRMALLSNAGYDFGDPFRHSPMGAWFEQVFVSAELDDLKPAASIYRHVASDLRIELGDMVFIDNKAENIEGAEALGITGYVFTSPPELDRFLRSLAG